jgi:FkbM family methyltransferase
MYSEYVMKLKFFLARLVAKVISNRKIRFACYTDLSLESALCRLQDNGLLIARTVLDVGASDGSWTTRILPFCSAAEYLLVEANPVHEEDLKLFCAKRRNCQYVLAAASDREGEIYFEAEEELSGKASHNPSEGSFKSSATTLDAEVAKRNLQPPFLLKLDTHGFEIPILKGAESILTQASVVIVEAYNFNISQESLTFWEMCRHMESIGFRSFDFISPMHRLRDSALWQFDIVFIRSEWIGFGEPVFGSIAAKPVPA